MIYKSTNYTRVVIMAVNALHVEGEREKERKRETDTEFTAGERARGYPR